jgi:hypothetical protein
MENQEKKEKKENKEKKEKKRLIIHMKLIEGISFFYLF